MNKASSQMLYWSLLEEQHWQLYLAASDKGLCFVGSQGQPVEQLHEWARRHYPQYSLVRDDDMLLPYKTELIEYIQRRRNNFSMPLVLQGTPFQEAVWQQLCGIPYGETRSYSEIALGINKPSSVRAVGAAIGANPVLIAVPCHRVIGKDGALTGYRGGISMKRGLLALEQN